MFSQLDSKEYRVIYSDSMYRESSSIIIIIIEVNVVQWSNIVFSHLGSKEYHVIYSDPMYSSII